MRTELLFESCPFLTSANAQKQLDTVKAKLANEKFTSKAPQNVIDGVKANGEKLEAKIKLILETLESYQ